MTMNHLSPLDLHSSCSVAMSTSKNMYTQNIIMKISGSGKQRAEIFIFGLREVIRWKALKMEGALFWLLRPWPQLFRFLGMPAAKIFLSGGRERFQENVEIISQVWSSKKIWNCRFLEIELWSDWLLSFMAAWYFLDGQKCIQRKIYKNGQKY